MATGVVSNFLKQHYRHFNAATVIDAAEAYKKCLENGEKMMITLAGAMSTAEMGIILAEMIRQNKVHAISCTGANLEEDVFNLVAHSKYKRIPDWRSLTAEQELELLNNQYARVTDTCIPEEEAIRKIEGVIFDLWQSADKAGERRLPHEFLYEMLNKGLLKNHYDIDPAHSWMIAAAEKKLPIFVPGWEDSTLGNIFASHVIGGDIKNVTTVRSGVEYMIELSKWYRQVTKETSIGFFQIGGGIAGDFPICVVPMMQFDLQEETKLWSYFCQISDSTTSYGSYSGAVPNEKITWGKLDVKCPKFIIESDATIVAPLIFAQILGW